MTLSSTVRRTTTIVWQSVAALGQRYNDWFAATRIWFQTLYAHLRRQKFGNDELPLKSVSKLAEIVYLNDQYFCHLVI